MTAAAPTTRQFCSRCGFTTSDYTTHEHDQRTPAERQAGRAPIIRRFHVCADCLAADAKLERRLPGATAMDPIFESLAAAAPAPMRHALLIDRHDEDGRIYYTAACRCCRWSDRSAFRALIVKAYQHHLRDAKRDPEGKHDAIRGQLRVLRGLLAHSTDGAPRDSA